ncbi:AI-2E family transporter [Clostridium carnis]
MKFYDKYNKIIDLTIIFIVVTIITLLIKNYFQPFIFVVIMLLITQPLYKIVLNLRLSTGMSVIISLLIINLAIFVIIFYFGNTLLGLIQKIYNNNYLDLEIFINNLKTLLHFDLNKIIQNLSKFLSGSIIRQGAVITGDGIISYFLANISVYFILVDKEKIYELISNIFPLNISSVLYKKNKNLKEVFKIEAKLVLLSSIIVTMGFKILGISNSLFLGGLCATLDILPFVGTTIVFIPIIIYNIVMKRYLLIVGVISLYLLERFTREILEAKFLSSKLEIHPLIVMLSIYIGVKMFGVIGVIAGPVYSIIAKDIIYGTS